LNKQHMAIAATLTLDNRHVRRQRCDPDQHTAAKCVAKQSHPRNRDHQAKFVRMYHGLIGRLFPTCASILPCPSSPGPPNSGASIVEGRCIVKEPKFEQQNLAKLTRACK
jgi:hypothetical protein